MGHFLCLLYFGGTADEHAARSDRTIEKFLEPRQVAWRGRRESGLCGFSSAGRICWGPWSRFFSTCFLTPSLFRLAASDFYVGPFPSSFLRVGAAPLSGLTCTHG